MNNLYVLQNKIFMAKRKPSDHDHIWSKKGGQPTLYRDDFTRQAESLTKLGATEEQVAEFFDVHPNTLYKWKLKHPDFAYAMKKGKYLADIEVANSLYKRAVGYEYTEKSTMKGRDANGEKYDYTKTTTKHIPGEVKAQIFWLVNRMPEHWAAVKRKEDNKSIHFDINQTLNLEKLTQKQIELLKSIAIKQLSSSEIEDITPDEQD